MFSSGNSNTGLEKPGLYLDEMVVFLWDEFQALVTVPQSKVSI